KQTFSRMVRNEFYAGWIVSGDVRVKGTHDPLISEELFAAVQNKLDGGQPHQKEHEDFPLRGFLRCAGCDKALTAGWVRGRNGQRYARYWCWRKGCQTAASKEELEDYQTMKASIAEETARIEETIKSLDAEKSTYADLMQQAEAEVISFEHAWLEGGIHRKRELQNALFPEGLTWWIKRKVFETGKGLSIDDLGTVFDT